MYSAAMFTVAILVVVHATWTWPPGWASGNALTDNARMSSLWLNIVLCYLYIFFHFYERAIPPLVFL